jgi:hypothetical protein
MWLSPRFRARLAALLMGACVWLSIAPAHAARRPSWGLLGPRSELYASSWIASGVHERRPFRLVPDASLGLLARYLAPGKNHEPEWRSFFRGQYGLSSWSSQLTLAWTLGSLVPEPWPLSVTPRWKCPKWKAPPAVTLARYDGNEHATLQLLDCDGGIAPDAIDVLSVLARPPGAPRPALPLPFEPSALAREGEWLPEIRLLHPRLIWVLQQLASAFPRRMLYIMSGYRHGGHGSLHAKGRALDVFVYGVPNEQVFAVCRALRDVGCGYYPNSKFVHVDVRPYGTERVLWVDASEPGTPSRYLDGFPGVLEPGRVWLPR